MVEHITEIFGCSRIAFSNLPAKEFSISFKNITNIEKKTIKKIIKISYFPDLIRIVNLSNNLVTKSTLIFQSKLTYPTLKSMYAHTKISKYAIDSLRGKNILKGRGLHNIRNGNGVCFYFNPDCDFCEDFITRRVLNEKNKNTSK